MDSPDLTDSSVNPEDAARTNERRVALASSAMEIITRQNLIQPMQELIMFKVFPEGLTVILAAALVLLGEEWGTFSDVASLEGDTREDAHAKIMKAYYGKRRDVVQALSELPAAIVEDDGRVTVKALENVRVMRRGGSYPADAGAMARKSELGGVVAEFVDVILQMYGDPPPSST